MLTFKGDQLLEINGQNVRESNQKEVADILRDLDGAIVLLLGRVPALNNVIQEWARKKAQICLRTRTSTWSSYGGNNKEKLQNQRPSLPVNKEPAFQSTQLLSPDSTFDVRSGPSGQTVTTTACVNSQQPMDSQTVVYNVETQDIMIGGVSYMDNSGGGGACSRTSSIRSCRSRLSIVAELDKKDSVDTVDDSDSSDNCSDNPLLPSIQVTEF